MSKEEIKLVIKVGCILFLCMGYILFMDAFLRAYNSDSKSVTIYIDKFGEANIEFYALIIVSIITLVGLYNIWKEEIKPKLFEYKNVT